MQSSRRIYDRIRWDPRFDRARFVIGYESRLPEPREVAFTAFVPDGEIPWHRVLYFREGDTIVWDRRTRVDTLGEAAPAAADGGVRAPLAGSGFFQPLPLHRFVRRTGAWAEAETVPREAQGGAASTAVRIVTYNVLCDAFDDVQTELARRIPALLAELRAIDADVLALQEASPPFVRALLGERWVRDAYAVSDGPAGRTVDPHGVFLMTRLPVAELVAHRFGKSRRAVVAEVHAGGAVLQVGTVHLASDRSPNAAEVRRVQLGELLGALAPADGSGPAAAIVGDFNWDDGELAETMGRHGFADAWTALRPGDPGLTFDPGRNALAARTSSTQRTARLDRVFVRDGGWTLRPTAAELFGTAPIDRGASPLFPSDHFGLAVRARLSVPSRSGVGPGGVDGGPASRSAERTPAVGGAPTYRTAVVLVPPPECWPQIQAIRLRHDRHAARWMPHVTLLYGFVPEEGFEEARAVVERALAEVAPFEVTLAELGTFAHRQSRTVWARPDATPAGALRDLQAALERAFPQCDEQGRKSPAGFTPHLSLAQVEDGDAGAEARIAAWRAAWKPLAFTAREVALISRRGDEPFAVRHVVRFQQGAARGGGADPAVDARQAAIGHLTEACLAALPGDLGRGALHLIGAVRLGVGEAGADVDAIAVGPAEVSREAFFAGAREWLEAAGGEVWVAGDAVAPVLRGVVAGVAVDLGYAALPPDLAGRAPEALDPADLARLDPTSRGALLAVRDAARVREAVAGRGREAAFRGSLLALKRWARARGLYSNAFGFLSGFGWTLLAAWAATREGDASVPATLGRAFAALGACDAAHPLALTDEAAAYAPRARDVLVLPTPSAPSRNAARNVTRATAAVLREEAARAGTQLRSASSGEALPDALFEPWDVAAGGGPLLDLSIRCAARRDLAEALGWVDGQVLGLLLDLEAGPAPRLRPDPRRAAHAGEDTGVRYTLALGAGAVDLAGVRAAAVRFEEAFRASCGPRAGASLQVSVRAEPFGA